MNKDNNTMTVKEFLSNLMANYDITPENTENLTENLEHISDQFDKEVVED